MLLFELPVVCVVCLRSFAAPLPVTAYCTRAAPQDRRCVLAFLSLSHSLRPGSRQARPEQVGLQWYCFGKESGRYMPSRSSQLEVRVWEAQLTQLQAGGDISEWESSHSGSSRADRRQANQSRPSGARSHGSCKSKSGLKTHRTRPIPHPTTQNDAAFARQLHHKASLAAAMDATAVGMVF